MTEYRFRLLIALVIACSLLHSKKRRLLSCSTAKEVETVSLEEQERLRNLRLVDLQSNRLPELGHFSQLTTLKIYNTDLNPLLSSLENIPVANHLKFLTLKNCKLRKPPVIKSFSHLNYLNLNDNKITDISPLNGHKYLLQLTVNRNRLTEPSATLLTLHNLGWFSCEKNNVESLASELCQKPCVIYLYGNPICTNPDRPDHFYYDKK